MGSEINKINPPPKVNTAETSKKVSAEGSDKTDLEKNKPGSEIKDSVKTDSKMSDSQTKNASTAAPDEGPSTVGGNLSVGNGYEKNEPTLNSQNSSEEIINYSNIKDPMFFEDTFYIFNPEAKDMNLTNQQIKELVNDFLSETKKVKGKLDQEAISTYLKEKLSIKGDLDKDQKKFISTLVQNLNDIKDTKVEKKDLKAKGAAEVVKTAQEAAKTAQEAITTNANKTYDEIEKIKEKLDKAIENLSFDEADKLNELLLSKFKELKELNNLDPEKRKEIINRLNEIPGIKIEGDTITTEAIQKFLVPYQEKIKQAFSEMILEKYSKIYEKDKVKAALTRLLNKKDEQGNPVLDLKKISEYDKNPEEINALVLAELKNDPSNKEIVKEVEGAFKSVSGKDPSLTDFLLGISKSPEAVRKTIGEKYFHAFSKILSKDATSTAAANEVRYGVSSPPNLKQVILL